MIRRILVLALLFACAKPELPGASRNATVGGGEVVSLFDTPRTAMPDILEGRIEPGRVFDRVTDLDGVPDGYRAMNDREAIKVMIAF